MKYREQPKSEIEELKKNLNSQKTLGGMLNIISEKYKLENVFIGVMSVPMITGQLITLLNTYNPEKK